MKMIRTAAVLMSLAMASCISLTSSNPSIVAPTANDWHAAFSRLRPEDQFAITHEPVLMECSSDLDSTLYALSGLDVTNEAITAERLDITAICNGFNTAFGNVSGAKWAAVNTRSFEHFGAPSGIQKHVFELHWTFREASTGKKLLLEEMNSGPGVNIKWFPPRTAVDAEMNQAFALTFLHLIVDLTKHRSAGL